MSFDIASLSRVGGRPVNEDDADMLQLEGAACWVVADGLGGHRGGEVASRTAVEAALASFRERPEISTDALRAHITRAHAALRARQQAEPALAQMRSTIVVLAASDREAVWGHVGDTRLYYLQDGRIVERTRDHSVSQALVDAGEVDERDQGQHEDRSRLLRCLGKEDDVEANVHEVQPLTRGDDFLLCTDGFWEPLSDPEIAIDACGAGDASAWLARLEARITRSANGAQDNYTASAIRVTSPDLPDPPPHDPSAVPVRADRVHQPPPMARGDRRSFIGRALAAALVIAAVLGLAIWWRPALVDRLRAWIAPPAPRAVTPTPPSQAAVEGRAGTAAPVRPAKTDAPTPPGSTASSSLPVVASPGSASERPTFETPGAVTSGRIYRPSTKETYGSLDAAIAAAAEGDDVWVGPGRFTGGVRPIAKTLHIIGAGADRSHLDFSGGRGLEIAAPDGSLQDLDVCCATRSAVVVIRGAYAGTVTRNRIRNGKEYGLRITGTARPRVLDNDITGNEKGKVDVGKDASPQIR